MGKIGDVYRFNRSAWFLDWCRCWPTCWQPVAETQSWSRIRLRFSPNWQVPAVSRRRSRSTASTRRWFLPPSAPSLTTHWPRCVRPFHETDFLRGKSYINVTPASREQCSRLQQSQWCRYRFSAAYTVAVTYDAFKGTGQFAKIASFSWVIWTLI